MASFVRTATDADLTVLARIEDAAASDRAAQGGFFLVVAEDEDTAPVGFVRVLEEEGVAHVEQLSVLPGHAGRGHGRALVDAALDEATARGLRLRIPTDLPIGMAMGAETFEELVSDELDRLPDDMVEGLENLVFVVEDRPEDGSLDLLGLYDGLAITERANYGMGELPDRIIVYREPHLAQCDDEQELRDEVHTTLVHEIAHYYGLDDAQLHELGWA